MPILGTGCKVLCNLSNLIFELKFLWLDNYLALYLFLHLNTNGRLLFWYFLLTIALIKRKSFTCEDLFDNIKRQVGLWIPCHTPKFPYSLNQVILNVSTTWDWKIRKGRKDIDWCIMWFHNSLISVFQLLEVTIDSNPPQQQSILLSNAESIRFFVTSSSPTS